jgi:hypothetical protein
MAASTRSSLISRAFSCRSTILWRCAANSDAGVGLCPQAVAANMATSSHCENRRITGNIALRRLIFAAAIFFVSFVSFVVNFSGFS